VEAGSRVKDGTCPLKDRLDSLWMRPIINCSSSGRNHRLIDFSSFVSNADYNEGA
jgi:hypothetical protein